MAAIRPNPRLQVGSAAWIAQERKTALEIVESEAEEFTFSARNEIEWLNEHMSEIFNQNQVNVANIFKTPGKLRGKTPRTAKKLNPSEVRAPLSDVFSATQKGAPSPFRQAHFERPAPSFRVAEDEPTQPVEEFAQTHRPSSSSTVNNDNPFQRKNVVHNLDSGFFGSQPDEATQPFSQPIGVPAYLSTPPQPTPSMANAVPDEMEDEQAIENGGEVETVATENAVIERRESEARRTTGGSFQSAHEDQSKAHEVLAEMEARIEPEIEMEPEAEPEAQAEPEPEAEPEVEPTPGRKEVRSPEQKADHVMEDVVYPNLDSPLRNQSPAVQSPREKTPQKSSTPLPKKKRSPLKELPVEPQPSELVQDEDENMDDAPVAASPSEGSSPIRPIVRKSSLNFASLPAREPLTNKKSIGNRTSRTSHLDQNRNSYYGRLTGGKSLGNVKLDNAEKSDDEMDVDEVERLASQEDQEAETRLARIHSKTSTQRLQDQISMLGQTQAITRPASKSLAGSGLGPNQSTQATQPPTPQKVSEPSPQQKNSTSIAPGAFPLDEEDSWIGPPPTTVTKDLSVFSPRPVIQKTYTTDVMENIHDKDTIGGSHFNIPKRGEEGRQRSPAREPAATGHTKSVSTSFIQSSSPKKSGDISSPPKPIAVSNPNPVISKIDEELSSLPRSPRTLRGSPLKAAKDKFSSILKSSRGLFASSAVVSAEAKTETLSPPSARIYRNPTPSLEDVLRSESNDDDEPLQATDTRSIDTYQSASKASIRKTRASTEREEKRKEEAAKEAAREAKEAQKMAAQLEKARMKVKEEARIFHEEQERVTALQRQMEARKEQEKLAKASQLDVLRSSPRKTKAQLEAEAIAAVAQPAEASSSKEVSMTDISSSMPPPAIPRPKSQIGRPGAKRPLRPTKETVSKAKPPTVIRVDTGSSREQQYYPSNTTLAATLQESLQAPTASTSSQPAHLRNKASTSSLQSKSSTNSFKAAANKALEAAARKKEQDELAAQRKREAKLEIERQRAAAKEEERRQQEVARKRELERQRDLQKDTTTTAEVKRAASRQAMDKRRLDMERAKETRAPPPAIRPQHNVDSWSDKALPPVPPQRNDLGGQTKLSRINPPMNTAKAPPKRPLQQENNDEQNSQSTMQRSGMPHPNETHHKRVRTSDYLDDDDELVESHPKMTAPPIRQSSIRPKEMATKSLFPSGYAHAPPPANLQRTTLMSQHQSKAGHPMDMAQVSKGPIPFASSSGQNGQPYKTPARPGTALHAAKSAKSVAKSSPRYENGENIDLPEILTDSEDEDEDEDKEKKKFSGLGWTDSPEIRKQLALQETIDPQEVFGRPGPLNMEEVFSKSKDRFHKFRARTSSANWSGNDRLTEDEVRKDLEARDRVRRQGGWTYDSMV